MKIHFLEKGHFNFASDANKKKVPHLFCLIIQGTSTSDRRTKHDQGIFYLLSLHLQKVYLDHGQKEASKTDSCFELQFWIKSQQM